MPSSEPTAPPPPHSTLKLDQNRIAREDGLIVVPVVQEPLPQVAQSHLPQKLENDIAVSNNGKRSKRFVRLSRVAAVILLFPVLRAVLGGVLGSRSLHNQSLEASEDSQTTHAGNKTDNTAPSSSDDTHSKHDNILYRSNIIVAVASDESNDTAYRFVQDPTSALIARVWDRRSSK